MIGSFLQTSTEVSTPFTTNKPKKKDAGEKKKWRKIEQTIIPEKTEFMILDSAEFISANLIQIRTNQFRTF